MLSSTAERETKQCRVLALISPQGDNHVQKQLKIMIILEIVTLALIATSFDIV